MVAVTITTVEMLEMKGKWMLTWEGAQTQNRIYTQSLQISFFCYPPTPNLQMYKCQILSHPFGSINAPLTVCVEEGFHFISISTTLNISYSLQ